MYNKTNNTSACSEWIESMCMHSPYLKKWQKTRLHSSAQIADRNQQSGLESVRHAANGTHSRKYASQTTAEPWQPRMLPRPCVPPCVMKKTSRCCSKTFHQRTSRESTCKTRSSIACLVAVWCRAASSSWAVNRESVKVRSRCRPFSIFLTDAFCMSAAKRVHIS